MAETSTAVWRYVKNPAAVYRHRRHSPSVDGAAEEVLHDLRTNGVAITSVDRLFPASRPLFEKLAQQVRLIQEEKEEELASARAAAAGDGAYKSFIVSLLGDKPVLDTGDPAIRLLISEPLLGIVNGYMGMTTQLRFFNVWHTLVSRGAPRQSQLWHRDPEDHLIAKVFIYLSDVDEGSGALTYAPGTHPVGNVKGRAEILDDPTLGYRRSTDEQIAKVLSSDRWVRADGPTGTIVFADTRGYHKGGHAHMSERVMLTAMFTSPGAKTKSHFERGHTAPAGLSSAQRYALGIR